MVWQSWEAFLAMGGYGPYVWGSVGTVALFVIAEALTLRRRHQAALAALDSLDHGTPS